MTRATLFGALGGQTTSIKGQSGCRLNLNKSEKTLDPDCFVHLSLCLVGSNCNTVVKLMEDKELFAPSARSRVPLSRNQQDNLHDFLDQPMLS